MKRIILALLLMPGAAMAQQFEATKVSPGVILQGGSFDASKVSPGVILQGGSFDASKVSPGVIIQYKGLWATKVSVGVVLQTAPASTPWAVTIHAPMTVP